MSDCELGCESCRPNACDNCGKEQEELWYMPHTMDGEYWCNECAGTDSETPPLCPGVSIEMIDVNGLCAICGQVPPKEVV